MFSPFNGYGPDGRRLYGKGGGDGGAGEMRRMEEERQQRTREAQNRINEIFGGEIVEPGPPTTVQGPGPFKSTKRTVPGAPVTRHVPGQFTDDYFTSIADAFMRFQQPLFEEQVTEARRRLPMQFASTANSAYQRRLGELETDVTRKSAMLKDKATEFSNSKRMEVERNRADLTSMANAGTDAAVLASQANARAAALSQAPTFEPIADLFQKYTAMQANNALMRGGFQNAGGPIVTRPLLFPSRGSAVRTVG